MIEKLSIDDIDVHQKRVFLRLDFNVPISDQGQILDDSRIEASLPTIHQLLEKKAKLIITSHLGRPKGVRDDQYSLKPVAFALEEKLQKTIRFCPVITGEIAKAAIELLSGGEVLLMENLRFYPEEEENDLNFCKEIASFIDLYVNDAFGTVHRAHASTYGLPKILPTAASGYLIQNEIKYLDHHLNHPEKPFIAIIGGAKVSDKILVLQSLLNQVDELIIGGGMAYTFLSCLGYQIGKSLFDEPSINAANEILKTANNLNKKIILPIDHIVTDTFSNDALGQKVDQNIPDGQIAMDIGEKTIQLIGQSIKTAKTIFWNGPMGVFEFDEFNKGTFSIANMIAKTDAISIVGGGDSVSAIVQSGQKDSFTHISTGGGASLSMIEGARLPGIEALTNQSKKNSI